MRFRAAIFDLDGTLCFTFPDLRTSLNAAMRELGYEHEDPVMSFCVLALPVSPQLKFSDVGIIDVNRQALVDLVK